MKILIRGKMKNKKISIGYRMTVLSMIKKILSEYDLNYFEEIFYYNGKKTKKAKPFTFSVFFEEYKINDTFIDVEGDVKIIISSPNMKLNMILFNGFMELEEYGDFIKKDVNLCKERKVIKDTVLMKTLSPIYIKDINGQIVTPYDENYNIEFNYFADLILRSYRGYGLKQKLQFNPEKMKKIVVKEEIKSFKEKTSKKFIFLTAYSGIFSLNGDQDDLNMLKELGVGARRSGFGTIDLY